MADETGEMNDGSPNGKAWRAAKALAARAAKGRLEPAELLAELAALDGILVELWHAALEAAHDAGDAAAFERALADPDAFAERWLARSFFGW